MATLVDNPAFTANEVYQIASTDPVEGAATGASFSGIGIDNEPHQQLANRTAFLKNRQDTNIANIAGLLAFVGEFVGSMQINGYVEIPFLDVSRGAIVAVVQWGQRLIQDTLSQDAPYVVTWPTPFPNAPIWALGAGMRNPAHTGNDGNDFGVQFVSATKTAGTFEVDVYATGVGVYGFNWVAIGF